MFLWPTVVTFMCLYNKRRVLNDLMYFPIPVEDFFGNSFDMPFVIFIQRGKEEVILDLAYYFIYHLSGYNEWFPSVTF